MSDNIVGIIGGELDDLLAPLSDIATSNDPIAGLRRVLRMCGWRMTSEVDPAPFITAIGTVADAVAAVTDGVEPEDLGAFIGALGAVGELIVEIEELIQFIGDGGPATPTDEELAAFGEDVLHGLAVRWLTRKPVLGDLAPVIRLVEPVDVPAMSLGGWLYRPAARRQRLRPQTIVDFVTDPVGYLQSILVPNGWAASTDAAATNLLLSQQLSPLLERLGGVWRVHPNMLASADDLRNRGRLGIIEFAAPVAEGAGAARFGTELELFSAADADAEGRTGPAVALAPFGGYQHTFDQGDWSVTLGLLLALGGVDAGDSMPALRISGSGIDAAPSLDARLDVGATLDVGAVIGGAASRFELGTLEVGAFAAIADDEGDVGFSILASGSKLVLSAADLGEAVAAVAQFENTIEFDLGIEWSLRGGLRMAGSASLEIEFSEGIDIGGVVSLSGLRVRLELAEAITLEAVTDARINLGPVAMAFEELGLGMSISFPPGGGNLGSADLAVSVSPPKGIGIRLDAGVVVGGGYLYADPDRGEFAGVLELSFPALSLSIKAVGILTTDLPGDAEGFALLLLVFTEFPAIQLGYGFTLNGVGGILGLQHGISIDALQAGMRTGALDNVLFPDDPVANAPALLADLRAIFPVTPGALTFGPALRIGWGQGIVTITLGLVLQFDNVIGAGAGSPQLARIVLLGQLKVVLPPIEGSPEIVKLLIDILGYYDFAESELGIDARLRDSHLAGLPLTGSLVVRARFGADPTFIMAIGGFHPRFTDLPPGLPPQDRLGVQLRYDIVTVQIGCYTAVTSNSFQVGAEAQLLVQASDFKVEAYFGFDALFLFEPVFHFEIEFRLGAAISWKDWDLASIRVAGRISGPGRWEISGEASITVLFWDVEIDFAVAWGDAPLELLPEAPVLPRILAELAAPASWSASLPSNRPLVSVRQTTADDVVAHPLGQLQVRQKVVPFGIDINRVGKTRPSDGNRFELTRVRVGDRTVAVVPTTEHFARAEFLALSEEAKLSSPSFERFDAGASIGTAEFQIPDTAVISIDPEYETGYLEAPDMIEFGRLPGALAVQFAKFGASARSKLRRSDRLIGAERLDITVGEAAHTVVDAGSMQVLSDLVGGQLTFTQAAQAASKSQRRGVVVEAVEAEASS